MQLFQQFKNVFFCHQYNVYFKPQLIAFYFVIMSCLFVKSELEAGKPFSGSHYNRSRQDTVVARTRIMSVGDRNEWILDTFRSKLIGLDGWLEVVMGDRKLGYREGRIKDESQDSGSGKQLDKCALH